MIPSCLRGPVALVLGALVALPYLAAVLTSLSQDPGRCCRSGACCLLLGRGHHGNAGHCQHPETSGASFKSCPEQPDEATFGKEIRPALVLSSRPWTHFASAGLLVAAASLRVTEPGAEPPTPPPRQSPIRPRDGRIAHAA